MLAVQDGYALTWLARKPPGHQRRALSIWYIWPCYRLEPPSLKESSSLIKKSSRGERVKISTSLTKKKATTCIWRICFSTLMIKERHKTFKVSFLWFIGFITDLNDETKTEFNRRELVFVFWVKCRNNYTLSMCFQFDLHWKLPFVKYINLTSTGKGGNWHQCSESFSTVHYDTPELWGHLVVSVGISHDRFWRLFVT